MRNIIKIVLTLVVILFIFSSRQAVGKDLPKPAKIVPANTIVLVDVENFGQLQKQFEKTNFYKLYKDQAMAAFIENVRTKMREKVGKLDGNNVLKTFFEADVWPDGRAAAALVPDSKANDLNEPDILFISQWGQNFTKIKDAVGKMVEKNSELGGHKKAAEDYRGVKIETMVDEKATEMVYCFIEDCFLASSDVELLKFAVAHIDGATGQSLGEDADYSGGFAATGPYHDIDIFVNLKQIIKMSANGDKSGDDKSIIKNLGLENIAGFSCAMGMARRDENGCTGKMFLKISGAKKGICKMLDVESGAFRIPKFIPSSAFSLTVFNLSLKKAYDEIYNIMYSIEPAGASAMCAPIVPPSPDGQPGLVLKADIIDHLDSPIVMAECLNKPFSKDSSPKDTLIAIGVSNRTALEKSLALLHSTYFAEGNPDAKRELLGHTIYKLDISRFFGSFSPGERTPLTEDGPVRQQSRIPIYAFTVTDSHLIYGTEAMVENAIRILGSPSGASIDSAKWFVSTKQSMPSVLGLASMEDNSASAELFWWFLKETTKARQLNTMVPSNPQMMLAKGAMENVDFSLLPPFESVRKYFSLFGMYGQSRPDGFFFEFNYLNPPPAATTE